MGISVTVLKCPACGNTNISSQRFCKSCGCYLSPLFEEEEQQIEVEVGLARDMPLLQRAWHTPLSRPCIGCRASRACESGIITYCDSRAPCSHDVANAGDILYVRKDKSFYAYFYGWYRLSI